MAFSRGPDVMMGGWNETISPNFFCAMSSTAAAPYRVARRRSKGQGLPPRCRCPSTVTRTSNPVRLMISVPTISPIPPSLSTYPSAAFSRTAISPPRGFAPSATTTMLELLPAFFRSSSFSHSFSVLNGISGIRITPSPPAIPAWTATQPVHPGPDLGRAAAADHDERIQAEVFDIADHRLGHVLNDLLAADNGLVRKGIAPIRRPENRAAEKQYPPGVAGGELARLGGAEKPPGAGEYRRPPAA